ncbi:MAG TPA: hypothetical protein VHF22_07725, partial [Planctomycetota bacterium]|nr:hypothetical protein [Planctomycetota bacterium]
MVSQANGQDLQRSVAVSARAEPAASARERRIALLETAAVLAAFHGYVLFGRPSLNVDYAVMGGLAVAVFAIFARRREGAAELAYVGDVRGAARLAWPAAVAVVLGASAIRLGHGAGLVRDPKVFPGLFLALLAYPIWGF